MDIRFLKSEIKAYGIKNMQEKTGLSRSHINSILKGLVEPKLSTLGKILDELGYDIEISKKTEAFDVNDELLQEINYLYWAFNQLGLPVRSYEHFDQLPNKSELLLASLLYAREDEVISGLLPIYIHKYFDDLDWHKVIRKAKDLRLLGYVIHLAMHCSGESKYNWLLLQIKRKLGAFEQENLNLIMENTEFYEKRCASVNNIVADSWLLNTTDELGILKQKFNRFF